MKPTDPFLIARTQGHVAASQPHVPRRAQGIQLLAQWKHAQAGGNAWLCMLIATGFQRLVAMALPGQPAAEMLPITAEMWCEVLLDMRVSEEQDRERIETGFRYLYRKIREWPQPADLIQEMPKRVEARRSQRDVPTHRERTEAEQAAATEALQQMKANLK